jgi:hypothetical protein
MRIVACALATLLLTAAPAVPTWAQTQEKTQKRHVKKERAQEAREPRENGYREMLADKIPMGTGAWWEQMRREGRLGGETP